MFLMDLRSEVPTIITPFITDQTDYVYAVNKLGNGVGMPQLQKITWEELGDSILKVVQNKGTAKRATEFAIKVCKENEAKMAADAIEDCWKDFGETNKFQEL